VLLVISSLASDGMKMKPAPPIAPPSLQRWLRLVVSIDDLADAVFRLAFRPSLFNALRSAWHIPSLVYVHSLPPPSSLGPPPEASCEHMDINGDLVRRKYGVQHEEDQSWGSQWQSASTDAFAQDITPGCSTFPPRLHSREHQHHAHHAAGSFVEQLSFPEVPQRSSGHVGRNVVEAYPMTGTAAAATASPAITVPDAMRAGIPTIPGDTRIAAGNFISVDSPTQALPTPSPSSSPPRAVAPTAVSTPTPAVIRTLVDTLTQKISELLVQQTAISDEVAHLLAEKKRIEADAVALEQRRRAVAQSLLEQQQVNEALEKTQQALHTISKTEKMWQDAAEIALGLQ